MSAGKTIARATVMIAAFTMLSRILGFAREMAMAYVFGASSSTDAYLVAITIPNIVFAVLGGSLVIVVVPIFTSYTAEGKREEAWQLFSMFATLLSIVLLVLAFAGIPLARQLVWLVAPGLHADTARLAAGLMAVMLPGTLLLSLASLFYGLLNANNKFGPPAIGPIISNVFLIIFILVGARFGVYMVAVGTLIGNALAILFQVPYLRRVGFRFQPRIDIRHPGVKQAFVLMVPLMISAGLGQGYMIIDRIMASGLSVGSISALNYAFRLIALPQGVIVLALGTAILPTLSKYASTEEFSGFNRTLLRAVKIVLLVALPAGMVLAALRYPLITLLFARGAFDERGVSMTALALLYFAVGLVGQCLFPVLTRGFYALHDTVTPLKTIAVTVVLNLVLSILLVKPMQHGGLALANSLAVTFNVVMLFYLLTRKVPGLALGNIITYTIKVASISLLAGGSAMFADRYLLGFLSSGTLMLGLRLAIDFCIALVVLVALCELLKLDEYASVKNLARQMLSRGLISVRAKSFASDSVEAEK